MVELKLVLQALGQDTFEEYPAFDAGVMRIRVFRTLAASPRTTLQWPELHFMVARPDAKMPADFLSYTLSRTGEGNAKRWYLWFHALNRSELVTLYGTTVPDFLSLKKQVQQHTQSSLEKAGITE